MGIKGNLSAINGIPFQAPPLAAVPAKYDPKTQAVGVGYTPEGLDQNTAYCKLLPLPNQSARQSNVRRSSR